MFQNSDLVADVCFYNGVHSIRCVGQVTRVSAKSVWAINQHGNEARYHADGRCIGFQHNLNDYTLCKLGDLAYNWKLYSAAQTELAKAGFILSSCIA